MLALWSHLVVSFLVSFSFFLGLIVLLKGKKKEQSFYFFLISIFIALFIGSAHLSEFFPFSAPSLALFFSKLTYAAVLNWGVFLFLFSLVFPKGKKISLKFSQSIFLLTLILSILIIFTSLGVEGIKTFPGGFDVIYGKGFYFLFAFPLSIFLIFSLFNIFKSYRASKGIERLQIQYLFIGLGLYIGSTLFFNGILPLIVGTQKYYFLGNYSSIFFLFFTALALLRYHLFRVEIILTEILVAFIGILLILQIVTAPSFALRVANAILFVLFCIGGILLIRSVFREIEIRKEIEKLSQAKTEFLSIASHQLRTPLSAIKGYLSMILEGIYGMVPERMRKPLENVYLSSERLIRLVNDLLAASRIEAGKVEMQFEEVNVVELIEQVIEEIKIKAEEKGLYLQFEKPKNLPKIKVDKEKIRQVILNLIDNAIRYTKEGGVKVVAEIVKKNLRIAVKDTGEGLTKEEISRLFESFSRGSAGQKYWTEGTGLGLYIAKKLIELHKGKIWAESPGKGQGSTFYIELPIQ